MKNLVVGHGVLLAVVLLLTTAKVRTRILMGRKRGGREVRLKGSGLIGVMFSICGATGGNSGVLFVHRSNSALAFSVSRVCLLNFTGSFAGVRRMGRDKRTDVICSTATRAICMVGMRGRKEVRVFADRKGLTGDTRNASVDMTSLPANLCVIDCGVRLGTGVVGG